jgi:hypothetical protein
MNNLILWVLFIAVVLVLAALGRLKRRKVAGLEAPWPLEPKRALLTDPEQIIYRRLVKALPHHIVLAQVQLLQMVRFKRRSPPDAVLNRMSRLSLPSTSWYLPRIAASLQRSNSTTPATATMTVNPPMHARLTR